MRTTSDVFKSAVSNCLLTPTDKRNIDSLTSSIETRLSKTFELRKFSLIGSHSRDSAIRQISDVDHLAVLSRDEARWGASLKNSTTFLNNVRRDLSERFWNTDV